MPIEPFEKWPQSTDTPKEFEDNGDYLINHMATKFVPQANALEENVNAKEESASNSERIVSELTPSIFSLANSVGSWSDQTGELNVPSSVSHSYAGGPIKNWQLLQNLTDVTSVEPGSDDSVWFDLTVDIYGGSDTITSSTDINLGYTSKRIQNVSMTVFGKFVTEIDAKYLDTGGPIRIYHNAGGYRFGVKDKTGNFLCSVAPGKTAVLYLSDNTISSGIWRVEGSADFLMSRVGSVTSSKTVGYMSSAKISDGVVLTTFQGGDTLNSVLETWTGSRFSKNAEIIISQDGGYNDCCKMAENLMCVVYFNTSDNKGYAQMVRYKPDTNFIALEGSAVEIFSNATAGYIQCDRISDTKIACFQIADGRNNVYGTAIEWDGSSFSVIQNSVSLGKDVESYLSVEYLKTDDSDVSFFALSGRSSSGTGVVYCVKWVDSISSLQSVSGSISTNFGLQYYPIVNLTGETFLVFATTHPSNMPYENYCIVCNFDGTEIKESTRTRITTSVRDMVFHGQSACKVSDTEAVVFYSSQEHEVKVLKIKAVGSKWSYKCYLDVANEINMGGKLNPIYPVFTGGRIHYSYKDYDHSGYLGTASMEVS